MAEAGIVVGLYLKRRREQVFVTKYNEDTGEPYQKPEFRYYWETDLGSRITFDVGEICGVKDKELQWFNDCRDRGVVGCPVVRVSSGSMELAERLPGEERIAAVQRNVERQLRALGCHLMPSVLVTIMDG